MIRYIEDMLLAFLQKRCKHPGEMVTADLLEGLGMGRFHVSYCNRCGAVNMGTEYSAWRRPDPNLWRG